jgi:hypothetical protein
VLPARKHYHGRSVSFPENEAFEMTAIFVQDDDVIGTFETELQDAKSYRESIDNQFESFDVKTDLNKRTYV